MLGMNTDKMDRIWLNKYKDQERLCVQHQQGALYVLVTRDDKIKLIQLLEESMK